MITIKIDNESNEVQIKTQFNGTANGVSAVSIELAAEAAHNHLKSQIMQIKRDMDVLSELFEPKAVEAPEPTDIPSLQARLLIMMDSIEPSTAEHLAYLTNNTADDVELALTGLQNNGGAVTPEHDSSGVVWKLTSQGEDALEKYDKDQGRLTAIQKNLISSLRAARGWATPEMLYAISGVSKEHQAEELNALRKMGLAERRMEQDGSMRWRATK